MKYFTKEWYRAALAEEQQRAAGGKLKFNKKPDNAMRDYQRALSKIQSKLPACVCKTFHGSVITDVAVRQDQVVLYFDNSESFSDVEKLVLYDADITCSEGDPVGKTWLHEEVSLADGAFCLAALLGDDQGELYEFAVRFTHAECVVTDYTDSTEAGMAETLESITALCAEEAGLDYDAPTPESNDLVTKKTHNLSVEAGIGLFLKKEVKTEKYGKFAFKVGHRQSCNQV